MKKIFLLLVLSIIFLSTYCFACEKLFSNNVNNTHIIKILNKTYNCIDNNCYDFSSFRYNKLTKTFYIDMIVDLMNWNAHEEYKSPYNDGYISHLIFETKLHDNEIFTKCKNFVVGYIVVDYRNDKASSAHYNIIAIHKGKPSTIKNIKEFENTFFNWVDINSYKQLLKTR